MNKNRMVYRKLIFLKMHRFSLVLKLTVCAKSEQVMLVSIFYAKKHPMFNSNFCLTLISKYDTLILQYLRKLREVII